MGRASSVCADFTAEWGLFQSLPCAKSAKAASAVQGAGVTGACSAFSSCASSALRCRAQAVLRPCPGQVADHMKRRPDLAVECLQEGHVPCVRHAS